MSMIHEKYSQLQLITPQAIHSTVLSDERSCLWFRKLFSLPQVIRNINSSEEGRKIYEHYRTFEIASSAFLILAFGCYIALLLFVRELFLALSLMVVVAVVCSVYCILKTRFYLAELAKHLITRDIPRFPPGVTLYQLGEIYSREYGAPSLVAIIWVCDQWLRNTYLLLFTSAFGVLFLPFWKMVLWLIAGYFLSACFIKAWIMFRQKI